MSEYIPAIKSFRFNVDIIKAREDKKGNFYVEGYASTSDLDRQGDIIVAEALEGAAKDLVTVNNTVFFGHNYSLTNSVGRIEQANVDDIGLKVHIFVSSWAKELRTKLKEGVINKFSIGGRILKYSEISREQAIAIGLVDASCPFEIITLIEKLELFEVSFVGVPANPNAQVVDTFSKTLHGLYPKKKNEGGDKMEAKKEAKKEQKAETKKEKKVEEKSDKTPKVEKKETKPEEKVEAKDKKPEEKKETKSEEKKVEKKEEKPKEKPEEKKEEKKPEVKVEKKPEKTKEKEPEKKVEELPEKSTEASEKKDKKPEEKKPETKKEEPKKEVSEKEVKEKVSVEEKKPEEKKPEEKKEEKKEAEEPVTLSYGKEVQDKITSLEKKIDDLMKVAEELKKIYAAFAEKVQKIEVKAEKKSIVRKDDDPKNKDAETTEEDIDKSFLSLMKGDQE
jgi:X-linked retinitis pigmentosa GTPase regulator